MEKTSFSEYSANYEESLGPRHKYFIRMKCREILDVLKLHFGRAEGLYCLDLGCGTGEAEESLPGLDIVGLDCTSGMLEHAKNKRLGKEFLLSSACALPFKDNSFDVIFSMCMIHHIPDDRDRSQVFKEARRVLKSGGLLLIFEHNPYNPFTLYVVKTCPIDRDARLILPKDLQNYYKSYGFQPLKTKFILFMPFASNAIRPIENALGSIPMGGQYYIIGKKEKAIGL